MFVVFPSLERSSDDYSNRRTFQTTLLRRYKNVHAVLFIFFLTDSVLSGKKKYIGNGYKRAGKIVFRKQNFQIRTLRRFPSLPPKFSGRKFLPRILSAFSHCRAPTHSQWWLNTLILFGDAPASRERKRSGRPRSDRHNGNPR